MAELHGTAKAVRRQPRAASHAAPAEPTPLLSERWLCSLRRRSEISIRERFRSRRGYRCTHRLCPAGSCRAGRDASQWLATICGFGLTAASTAMEAHMTFAQQLVRMPQVALALRQHVVFNELAMAWCRPQSRSAHGLH